MHGAGGRMGRAVLALVADDPRFAAAADLAGSDVVIDFSRPEGTLSLLDALRGSPRPLVCGTTGFSPEQWAALSAAATVLPLVYAANFSVGVAVLARLSELAARALDAEYEAAISEAHHSRKVDAPSGTALRLAEAVQAGGRDAPPCSAIRAGDIVGEHTVLFAGRGERIELTHRAGSREIFARGALDAALWLRAQAPGLYGMNDVLGLD